MTPWADIYPEEWTPPCPKEEWAAEEWKEYQEHKDLKA